MEVMTMDTKDVHKVVGENLMMPIFTSRPMESAVRKSETKVGECLLFMSAIYSSTTLECVREVFALSIDTMKSLILYHL